MLDSIKATLVRVLGPESAEVVEFYVDKHLALEDPRAFEQALADFLGSQAGGLLMEAIKSDLMKENPNSKIPVPVSRFLRESAAPLPARGIQDRLPESPISRFVPNAAGGLQERFVRTARMAMEKGITFKELAAQGLVASQGETCGYATLACLGRKALEDPNAFVERVTSIFSLSGITILDGLTVFCEKKARAQVSTP